MTGISDMLSSSSVQEELEAILASSFFRTSQRCSQMLRYVVEQFMLDPSVRLKERTIGIAVFKRSCDYDTANDTVVRTTAGEIRKCLAQYYAGQTEAAVRIHLPAGAYFPAIEEAGKRKPRFVHVEPNLSEAKVPILPTRRMLFLRRGWLVILALSVGLTASAVVGLHFRTEPAERFWGPMRTAGLATIICLGDTNRIPAPAEGTTAPESATGDNEQAEGEQPRVRGGFQKRIDKLTRSIGDKDRYIEYLHSQVAGIAKPAEEKMEPKPEGKPKADDFEDQASFIEALTDYKAKQAAKEVRRQAEEERRTGEARQHQESVREQFTERQAQFRKSTPDYDEALAEAADTPMSAAVAEEISAHDHGPALLYYLAKNPDVAEKLVKLTPLAVAREVARLESKFVPSSDASGTRTPAVSRAPKPPTPVGNATRTSGKDPGDMSPSEYRDWRRKEFPSLER